jgi:ATP-dependent helicase HrpA
MEVPVGKQTVLGYPALVDDGETVSLKVFDSAEEAAETHRKGLAACSCCSSRNR